MSADWGTLASNLSSGLFGGLVVLGLGSYLRERRKFRGARLVVLTELKANLNRLQVGAQAHQLPAGMSDRGFREVQLILARRLLDEDWWVLADAYQYLGSQKAGAGQAAQGLLRQQFKDARDRIEHSSFHSRWRYQVGMALRPELGPPKPPVGSVIGRGR